MTASSATGTSGRKPRIEGIGFVAILIASSVNVSAKNGVRPASSSKRMTPSAQMSVRESTSLEDCICSGDM